MQNIKELREIKILLQQILLILNNTSNRPQVMITRRIPGIHTRVVGERVRMR